jgi:hypothetical protein
MTYKMCTSILLTTCYQQTRLFRIKRVRIPRFRLRLLPSNNPCLATTLPNARSSLKIDLTVLFWNAPGLSPFKRI